eukprot:1146313-Prorocentrum_minimum.AAC.1
MLGGGRASPSGGAKLFKPLRAHGLNVVRVYGHVVPAPTTGRAYTTPTPTPRGWGWPPPTACTRVAAAAAASAPPDPPAPPPPPPPLSPPRTVRIGPCSVHTSALVLRLLRVCGREPPLLLLELRERNLRRQERTQILFFLPSLLLLLLLLLLRHQALRPPRPPLQQAERPHPSRDLSHGARRVTCWVDVRWFGRRRRRRCLHHLLHFLLLHPVDNLDPPRQGLPAPCEGLSFPFGCEGLPAPRKGLPAPFGCEGLPAPCEGLPAPFGCEGLPAPREGLPAPFGCEGLPGPCEGLPAPFGCEGPPAPCEGLPARLGGEAPQGLAGVREGEPRHGGVRIQYRLPRLVQKRSAVRQ